MQELLSFFDLFKALYLPWILQETMFTTCKELWLNTCIYICTNLHLLRYGQLIALTYGRSSTETIFETEAYQV